MAEYSQQERPLRLTTPLGPDELLLAGLEGTEGLSQLFRFHLGLLAEKSKAIPFDRLLGQPVSVAVTLLDGTTRHFHGIVARFAEGATDETFTHYQAEVVPAFWRWTKKFRFRIFQHQSVADILKVVLQGLDVRFQLARTYRPRNFCVQFHETDFAFASRLMELEGIYYYFEHRPDGHTLVVTDQSLSAAEIAAPSRVRFDTVIGGLRDDTRVHAWSKSQEVCSGKFTFWDYSYQLPGQNLEATRTVSEPVAVGTVTHDLRAGGADDLEVYQFTGAYGLRYDSIDAGGAEHADELQHLFEDNQHLTRVAQEREACQALRAEGAGTCGRFTPGQTFTLTGHGRGDGDYLLTEVRHHARQAGYCPGEQTAVDYHNDFSALPKGLPYRPPRVTPRPNAYGFQTAVVVGPPGEEIFTDKFGRVKVQFFWDRDGRHNADSSCWIRVAQMQAGKGFGALSVPRVGQEVVVAFAGGNPDRPIILGSVYNAQNPPPVELPRHRAVTAFKTHTVQGDARQFSGLAFEDQPGEEHLQLHAQRDMTISTEQDRHETVGTDREVEVGRNHRHRVGATYHVSVGSPGGSGTGGGAIWQDDPINDPENPAAPVAKYAGNYVVDVWGSQTNFTLGNNDCVVIGAYSCAVVGNQAYFTTGLYENIVLGGMLGAIFNITWGRIVNIQRGNTYNYVTGDTINWHDEGYTQHTVMNMRLSADLTLSLRSPIAIMQRVGASIIRVRESEILLRAGSSGILIRPTQILLSVGTTLIRVAEEGILLDAGGTNWINISDAGVTIGALNQDIIADLQQSVETIRANIL